MYFLDGIYIKSDQLVVLEVTNTHLVIPLNFFYFIITRFTVFISDISLPNDVFIASF